MKKPILRIECQSCRTLWNIMGISDPKLKGRLLINPITSICYLCEKEWGLPPQVANLCEVKRRKARMNKVKPCQ